MNPSALDWTFSTTITLGRSLSAPKNTASRRGTIRNAVIAIHWLAAAVRLVALISVWLLAVVGPVTHCL